MTLLVLANLEFSVFRGNNITGHTEKMYWVFWRENLKRFRKRKETKKLVEALNV